MVSKILLIIMILFIFYLLTNRNKEETFIDSIEKEKMNYLKMKETYIEPQDTSIELLYANYSGEEVGSDVWKNKTLDQCVDTCNKLDGCTGFSRDSVLDTEPSNCYPRSAVNNCHSNRKGNPSQMQNAIKYDSYIKSNVSNVLNNCIGDSELTLNRIIYIKSYAQPNQYIGINGDSRVILVSKDTNNFNSNCNFRLEVGKDGIGTIAFLHIGSGKYLYRDTDDNIILKSISNPGKTIDNQRASFNLYDASSGGVMLKPMMLDGETTDKFIMLDDNTNYLIAKILSEDEKNNSNNKNAFFYIVDTIISSNIITNKNNIPTKTQYMSTQNMPTTTSYNISTPPPYMSTQNMPTTEQYNMPTTTSYNISTPPPYMSTKNMPTTEQYNMPTTTSYNISTPPPYMSIKNMPTTTSYNIQKKTNIPPTPSYNISTTPYTTTQNISTPPYMSKSNKMSNKNYNKEDLQNIKEGFSLTLDTTNDIPVYNNLFTTPTNIIISDYIQDNYSPLKNVSKNSETIKISSKLNNITINKELSNSLHKNQDEYNAINELNKEIEQEIANLNTGLNKKNDIIINKLDKMRVSDLANDYFFLKNLTSV